MHGPLEQLTVLGEFGIDPGLGVTASIEDSCSQAILKFQPHNSFDYRVRYEPQLPLRIIISSFFSNIQLDGWYSALQKNSFFCLFIK